GDGAPDDEVRRLPDLAHAADGDARGELIPTAEREAARGSHLLTTASMTFFAIGAAIRFPNPVARSSITTATATWGSFAGANPVNQRVYGSPGPFSAVPVFPATSTPSILALFATPLATPCTISCVIVAAVSGLIGVAKAWGWN